MLWIILTIIAAIFSGAAIVVEKRTLLKEHAMEYTTVFAVFIFLLSLALLPKVELTISFKHLFFIFSTAFLASLALFFEAKGIRHMEVSIASPLMAFGPAITLLLSFTFLNERISILNGAGILFIIIGAYFLETHTLSIHFFEPMRKLLSHKHTFFIFAAMILYAIVVVIDKYILASVDIYTFIFFFHLFIALNFIIFICLFHDGLYGIVHGIRKAGKWILLITFLALAVKILYYNALSMHNASLVYPVLKMNTLFATVVGGTLFHDHNLKYRILSSVIMLIGVFFIVL